VSSNTLLKIENILVVVIEVIYLSFVLFVAVLYKLYNYNRFSTLQLSWSDDRHS